MVINECKRCVRIIVLSSLFSTALSLQFGYQSTFIINQHATPSIYSPRASKKLRLQTYRQMKRDRCVGLSSSKGDENGDDASKVRELDVYVIL